VSSETRDEREIKAALAVHTPDFNWLPSIKVDLHVRRLWDKRQERFAQSVANATGRTFEELQEQIEAADGLTDVLLIAAKRAGERGDAEYTDTLARLVAAAFIDCARIDTTAYLVNRIVKLEPMHLRVLLPLANAVHEPTEEEGEAEDSLLANGRIRIEPLAHRLGIDKGIAESCLAELASAGFVVEVDYERKRLPTQWSLSDLGRSAGVTINEVRQKLHKMPVVQ